MILNFKLTRNFILPTKHSVYKHFKLETERLKQYTTKSMHHEKLKARGFENLPRKVIVEMEERSSEIKESAVWVLEVQENGLRRRLKLWFFRVSWEGNGVRKKKKGSLEMLYKFVCGIKKV